LRSPVQMMMVQVTLMVAHLKKSQQKAIQRILKSQLNLLTLKNPLIQLIRWNHRLKDLKHSN
ncbi:hypothetical protein ACLBPW_30795, partial [Klebsiella pneumoniae]|uniref:hypothetical protein n=1 Tax=Klebsiella pneumoniae TaxID=573 RepID=UPI0039690D15